MTLNDVITLGMCFLMFVYIHTCLCFVLIGGNLTVGGEPQGNWIWNSNSQDVVASSRSFSHPATRAVWVLFNVFSIFSSTSLGVCLGSKGGAVVRALASHQCGPGSNPGIDAICGLSLLLVLSLAPRGFSPGTLVFSSPQKPTFSNSDSIWNARTHLNDFI